MLKGLGISFEDFEKMLSSTEEELHNADVLAWTEKSVTLKTLFSPVLSTLPSARRA